MSATDIDMLLSCANCGKGEEDSTKLKKCSACLSVKYCSAECQKAHRPQHKKECKKRAAELHDEKLFKEVEPEECPICMLPLPFDIRGTIFHSCCGKVICKGCIRAMFMSEGKDICPFCRAPHNISDEEEIKRLNKLMNNGSADAFYTLGGYYARGLYGMPQDHQKANELYLKAGKLGCSTGYFNLGQAYREKIGVEVDMKKAKYYYELAAMMGSIVARCNLGIMEGRAGNIERAIKHRLIAARAGDKLSLNKVKDYFMQGIVTKDEYASTLRAHHKSLDENEE